MLNICFIGIGIALFVLGRSSALNAQSLSHLEQLNASSPAKVEIAQSNRLNNPNALSRCTRDDESVTQVAALHWCPQQFLNSS